MICGVVQMGNVLLLFFTIAFCRGNALVVCPVRERHIDREMCPRTCSYLIGSVDSVGPAEEYLFICARVRDIYNRVYASMEYTKQFGPSCIGSELGVWDVLQAYRIRGHYAGSRSYDATTRGSHHV